MNTTNTAVPMVGMGATIRFYTDSKAATVIQITHKGKRIVLRQDKATRVDQSGVSESQTYNYSEDPDGAIYIATLRKNGNYKLMGSTGSGSTVTLGVRREYYDYSF